MKTGPIIEVQLSAPCGHSGTETALLSAAEEQFISSGLLINHSPAGLFVIRPLVSVAGAVIISAHVTLNRVKTSPRRQRGWRK